MPVKLPSSSLILLCAFCLSVSTSHLKRPSDRDGWHPDFYPTHVKIVHERALPRVRVIAFPKELSQTGKVVNAYNAILMANEMSKK